MGLFRRRAKKNREKAAFLAAQTKTAQGQAEVARREVTAEEQAEVAGREVTVEEQAEVARREVAAEERPNPDHPGWGQTIGQEIGKVRANRISQE